MHFHSQIVFSGPVNNQPAVDELLDVLLALILHNVDHSNYQVLVVKQTPKGGKNHGKPIKKVSSEKLET